MGTFWVIAIAIVAISLLFALAITLRRTPVQRTLLEKIKVFEKSLSKEFEDGRQDNWSHTSHDPHDGRRSYRRKGNWTPVLVCTPVKYPHDSLDAMVIDRSSGGLGIACESPFDVGSTIYVGRQAGLKEPVWISAIVRNVRQHDDIWLIGCEFLEKPETTVLLLFG